MVGHALAAVIVCLTCVCARSRRLLKGITGDRCGSPTVVAEVGKDFFPCARTVWTQ